MVEKKFASVLNDGASEVEASVAKADLDAQIADLRSEISRLTDSVSAIGNSAKAVVQSEAEVMADRLRERVRAEPISTLATIAGISFVMGMLFRR
ncbi:hypothetical protein BJF93_14250 [Xaviernesmea oryzae]|uniref:DUF883 domain-containing protein n=1 Tax=Xaviernesmea oryzae TaxID=464029 RepID=A0A1Q9ARD3_9HYPH|nr:hypothetical protein [Xaviernesmea oryzae]OLP57984.1 hypothetical protein BJF93_14250 [Xaviernesmea oryzae]SEL27820.1 hypothetical protein SAMN04487976_10712 [Xaviernesmea oryzae]